MQLGSTIRYGPMIKPSSDWKKVGQQGPKEAYLEYINEVWTDLRPLSLKVQMAAAPDQLTK